VAVPEKERDWWPPYSGITYVFPIAFESWCWICYMCVLVWRLTSRSHRLRSNNGTRWNHAPVVYSSPRRRTLWTSTVWRSTSATHCGKGLAYWVAQKMNLYRIIIRSDLMIIRYGFIEPPKSYWKPVNKAQSRPWVGLTRGCGWVGWVVGLKYLFSMGWVWSWVWHSGLRKTIKPILVL